MATAASLGNRKAFCRGRSTGLHHWASRCGPDKAVKEIGGNVTAFQGDVSVLADLDRLYALVKEKPDHIDVLFANAGNGEFAALGQIAEEHFDKTFATNVKGTVFTV